MAGKAGMKQVAAATGIAAGIGAAQLGLGYGLGVVWWPATAAVDNSVWLGSLGWATWIAASSTVFGAVIAERFRGASAGRPGGPFRLALAAAAAIGALLTVVLIAVPARSAVRPDTFAPHTIAGGYAVIGIGTGLLIAYWAVVSRPVAANLVATACYLWTLAAAGIVVELTAGPDSVTYLTSWQFADLGTAARYGTIYWPSALLTLLAALIIGVIGAWRAARRGNLGIGTAASGAVGPLLVAAAFFVLAPQLTGALGQLESAYLIAPYAIVAGLAGSALTVAVGRWAAERRRARRRPASPTVTGKAAVPRQPLAPAAQPQAGARAVSPEAVTGSPEPADGPAGAEKEEPTGAKEDRPAAALQNGTTGAEERAEAGRVKAQTKTANTPTKRASTPTKRANTSPKPASTPATQANSPADAATPEGEPATKAALKPDPAVSATAQPNPPNPTANRARPSRSTVAAPPPSPAVAKINPPRDPSAGTP